jgi:GNAT superfamily N-acetyltransferase
LIRQGGSVCVAFAYLMDVFVLEEHRGQGLAHWLMETIVSLPELQGVRSWLLKTCDGNPPVWHWRTVRRFRCRRVGAGLAPPFRRIPVKVVEPH